MSGFTTASEEEVALQTPPVRIFSLPGGAPPPRAKVPASPIVTHRFGNAALNSRLAVALPEGEWKVLWQADLDAGLNPAAILSGWDRYLVWGWRGWQLFEPGGKSVATGLLDSADVLLDDQSPVFYLLDASGEFCARHADNGKPAFELEAPSRRQFQIAWMARYQDRLIATGIARPPQPHAVVQPHTSVIQSHRLGAGRAELDRELTHDSAQMLSATNGNLLALAATNDIFLATPGLNIRGAIEGEFEPLAMSLDEADRIYLIVRDKQGQAFWLLTATGRLVMSIRLPAGSRAGSVPPIAGYNHAVYVFASGKLLVISPDGKSVRQEAVSEAAFGSVTPGDSLLLANGPELEEVSLDGGRRTLHRFDDWLRAPAILTPEGDILAVTARRLYRLTHAERTTVQ